MGFPILNLNVFVRLSLQLRLVRTVLLLQTRRLALYPVSSYELNPQIQSSITIFTFLVSVFSLMMLFPLPQLTPWSKSFQHTVPSWPAFATCIRWYLPTLNFIWWFSTHEGPLQHFGISFSFYFSVMEFHQQMLSPSLPASFSICFVQMLSRISPSSPRTHDSLLEVGCVINSSFLCLLTCYLSRRGHPSDSQWREHTFLGNATSDLFPNEVNPIPEKFASLQFL